MIIFYFLIFGLVVIIVFDFLTRRVAQKDINKLKKEFTSRLSLTTLEPTTSQLYKGYTSLKKTNLEEFKIAELVLKVEKDLKIMNLDFPLIDKLTKYFVPLFSAIITAFSIPNIDKPINFINKNYLDVIEMVKVFTPVILLLITSIFILISVKNFAWQLKLFNERKLELISTHLLVIDFVSKEES
ncbi:hypothetical protein J25TS5_14760 [Paenibacillus faecis]|uniref:hypothetical protein n=1 Tax=Paenibacillus faecis TaxID=862114 RepID=UPI001AFEE763|nr:hypothetical protein [Paenibacillus faecis]GIO84544.1 hypothetical protein J25TS5_14760 [Paenibacillus faecis]